MRIPTISLGIVVLLACAGQSHAAVRQFGNEPQKSPLWTGALDELVNSPERAAGESSFGKTDFYFNGDVKTINRLIAKYAELDQPHIYVAINGDYRAALQVQHHDDRRHYLTVYVNDEADLKGLELPPQTNVEAFPPVGESIDPVKKAAERQLWEQVQTSVRQHDAKQRELEKGKAQKHSGQGDEPAKELRG